MDNFFERMMWKVYVKGNGYKWYSVNVSIFNLRICEYKNGVNWFIFVDPDDAYIGLGCARTIEDAQMSAIQALHKYLLETLAGLEYKIGIVPVGGAGKECDG